METAPLNPPLEDFGPRVRLLTEQGEVIGYWVAGYELGEIWVPPGWYSDDGIEISDGPQGWRP